MPSSRKRLSESTYYPKAPIFEAVIELRFEKAISKDAQLKAVNRIAQNYSTKSADEHADFEVFVKKGEIEPRTRNVRTVFRLGNDDQTDLCTVDIDRVYWSKLAPYLGWEDFFSRFVRDLNLGFGRSKSLVFTRIGVRFRNRFDIQREKGKNVFNYERFLTANLNLPDILDPIDLFDWKIEKHFPDVELRSIVMSGVSKPEIPGTVAILLDIDVIKDTHLFIKKFDPEDTLSPMRALKNKIFEASITDFARESFLK